MLGVLEEGWGEGETDFSPDSEGLEFDGLLMPLIRRSGKSTEGTVEACVNSLVQSCVNSVQ